MTYKLTTLLKGLLCFLFSLTAPFMVPFALLYTARDAKDLAWSWYDTPDEPDLYDLDIEAVRQVYERWGHWLTAWYWFGLRNRGHGFDSLFSKAAPAYWPDGEASYKREDGFFITQRRLGQFLFVFGWQVYSSQAYVSKLEYRPRLSIKYRPAKAGVAA